MKDAVAEKIDWAYVDHALRRGLSFGLLGALTVRSQQVSKNMKHWGQVRCYIQTMLFKSQPHDAGATAPDKDESDSNVVEANGEKADTSTSVCKAQLAELFKDGSLVEQVKVFVSGAEIRAPPMMQARFAPAYQNIMAALSGQAYG